MTEYRNCRERIKGENVAGKDTKREIGRRGEEAVCLYLSDRGHSILERNWRTGHLEVDIISLAGNGIHFVEVKSRTAPAAAGPEESVGPEKQRRIARAALRYASGGREGRFSALEMHLDVASVIFDGEKAEIDYMEDAYLPFYF